MNNKLKLKLQPERKKHPAHNSSRFPHITYASQVIDHITATSSKDPYGCPFPRCFHGPIANISFRTVTPAGEIVERNSQSKSDNHPSRES